MPRRPPRGPRSAEFQALQARWDARLRRAGFLDCERGSDLNAFPGSTFESERIGPRGARVCRFAQIASADTDAPVLTYDRAQLEAEAVYGSASLWDVPRVQAWAKFSAGAHALPDGATKNLLLAIAEAGCITHEIRRRWRKSRQNCRTIFTRHCRALKLPANKLLIPGRMKKRA